MTMQKVWLLGAVAHASQSVSDEWGAGVAFVVATSRDDPGALIVDHHHVRYPHAIQSLALGAELLVEGQVVWDCESRSHIVVALSVVMLTSPDVLDSKRLHTNTHRSPTPHLRNGHWRRLRAGHPEERLVWVRESHVGDHAP